MSILVFGLIVFVAVIILALIKEFKKTPEELKRDSEKQIWKARGKPLDGTFELPKDVYDKIEDTKSSKDSDKK